MKIFKTGKNIILSVCFFVYYCIRFQSEITERYA